MPQQFTPSRGHLGIINGLEYHLRASGDLYRAPLHNALDLDGYRQGRWEMPPHLALKHWTYMTEKFGAEAQS